MSRLGAVHVWLRDFLRDLPAWLVSMIVHIVAMILMALYPLGGDEKGHYITLSTEIADYPREGGKLSQLDPTKDIRVDLPADTPNTLRERERLMRANQDALQLRVDDETARHMPDVALVRSRLASEDPTVRMLAARDPRLRVEMVKREGGTVLTEAAVARGLGWLALHQDKDGSWSATGFHRAAGCNGRCRSGRGRIGGKVVGTSLALLPYLGAGQTHQIGRYKETVSRGLAFLLRQQDPKTGDLGRDASGNGRMYVHGQAAIVLCEAYQCTGDEKFRAAAQKAIDFIVKAQHRGGGWRYRPGEAGDTSVIGWQLMALKSAEAAYLKVPKHTWERAGHYLDSVQYSSDRSRKLGDRYSYRPGHKTQEHTMTAEALLCRMYLGWKKDDLGMGRAVRFLADRHPPDLGRKNLYYWYYATQVMHHWGGPTWKRWNLRMRETLIAMQETRGHEAGSWHSSHNFDATGGRVYATSLAICTLEIYYRHAPLFRAIDLD